eukprot:1509854-Rhodomonas_salina.1
MPATIRTRTAATPESANRIAAAKAARKRSTLAKRRGLAVGKLMVIVPVNLTWYKNLREAKTVPRPPPPPPIATEAKGAVPLFDSSAPAYEAAITEVYYPPSTSAAYEPTSPSYEPLLTASWMSLAVHHGQMDM